MATPTAGGVTPAPLARPATTQTIVIRPKPVPPPETGAAPRPYDLRRLSPEEVRERGAELSGLIASAHPLRDDAAAIRRLGDLLGHLAPARSRPDEPIRFHVLDSAEVNAFSHIGGHVYASRGVFSLVQTDAELEFVVAHELAHIELGHAAARLDSIPGLDKASPGLVPALFHLIALGFSAEQELEADDWAYRALRRAGRSHRESVLFLRRYAGHAEAAHLAGRQPPRTHLGDSRQDFENNYPAHPPARERLNRLEPRSGAANAGRAAAGSPR
jgi:predicted Zn-dependent protease